MKEQIDEIIEKKLNLPGTQFHELSVVSLKEAIRDAVGVIANTSTVVSTRFRNTTSTIPVKAYEETVWLRQLLVTWFTKQFTNRRTERLHAKQKRAKGEVCPGCSLPARLELHCDNCDPPQCDMDIGSVFPFRMKTYCSE